MRPFCFRVPDFLRCFTPTHQRLIARSSATYFPLIAAVAATAFLLIGADPAAAAGSVPTGAKDALAPVTKMIATLIAIAIGLGVAVCGAVIVWGGIEKTLAGADANHDVSQRTLQAADGWTRSSANSRRRFASRRWLAAAPIGMILAVHCWLTGEALGAPGVE